MRWLLRPGSVLIASVVLLFAAAAVWFWPVERDITRPVPAGDGEIAWLNPATGSVAWERFVAAMRRLASDRPDLNLEILPESNPFPPRTTDVPEIAVSVRGSKSRLWFRWYKLTRDIGQRQWVRALARRATPPLAVIGGGTSDRAFELARELRDHSEQFVHPPPFIITSATAERIPDPTLTEADWPTLMEAYPTRSFRFCFTNRQMAEAVTEFIWSKPDLRPDAQPVYGMKWEDDPYSRDLFQEFRKVLLPEGRFGRHFETVRKSQYTATVVADIWAWAGERMVGPVTFVPPTSVAEARATEWAQRPISALVKWDIPYSAGGYDRPNRWEEAAALSLVGDYFEQNPAQRRPLLVVPGSPQSTRRLLRAIISLSPAGPRHAVVATGDYIDFNTVYRDRNIAWPIQDLPVTLVAFCHRNPVDPGAFRPDNPRDADPPDPAGKTSTGTHDLLLYRDIIETIVDCVYGEPSPVSNPDDLRRSLANARTESGGRRFDAAGNLNSGRGEYVICLRPVSKDNRVLPVARLQVWRRPSATTVDRPWEPVLIDGKLELEVPYTRGWSDETP